MSGDEDAPMEPGSDAFAAAMADAEQGLTAQAKVAARVMGSYMAEGFTREEAMQIVMTYVYEWVSAD